MACFKVRRELTIWLAPNCLYFTSALLIHNCSVSRLGMNGKPSTEQEMEKHPPGPEVWEAGRVSQLF